MIKIPSRTTHMACLQGLHAKAILAISAMRARCMWMEGTICTIKVGIKWPYVCKDWHQPPCFAAIYRQEQMLIVSIWEIPISKASESSCSFTVMLWLRKTCSISPFVTAGNPATCIAQLRICCEHPARVIIRRTSQKSLIVCRNCALWQALVMICCRMRQADSSVIWLHDISSCGLWLARFLKVRTLLDRHTYSPSRWILFFELSLIHKTMLIDCINIHLRTIPFKLADVGESLPILINVILPRSVIRNPKVCNQKCMSSASL